MAINSYTLYIMPNKAHGLDTARGRAHCKIRTLCTMYYYVYIILSPCKRMFDKKKCQTGKDWVSGEKINTLAAECDVCVLREPCIRITREMSGLLGRQACCVSINTRDESSRILCDGDRGGGSAEVFEFL